MEFVAISTNYKQNTLKLYSLCLLTPVSSLTSLIAALQISSPCK